MIEFRKWAWTTQTKRRRSIPLINPKKVHYENQWVIVGVTP
jgi:hypothetical protein